MNNEILNSIRNAEKKSHIEIYSTAKLFESGSWLQKPVKTVMDLLDNFKDYTELNVLDLGCGVGRNCIPIAQEFKNIDCNIDCIDILDFAIDELNNNSINFGVEKEINGIVSSIDEFKIPENRYDLIISVSALEHINSEIAFIEKWAKDRNITVSLSEVFAKGGEGGIDHLTEEGAKVPGGAGFHLALHAAEAIDQN